jgi:multiple sugar transport system substrate-binding protein
VLRYSRLLLLFGLLCGLMVASTAIHAQDSQVTLNVVGFVVGLEEQGTPLDQAYQKFISDFEAKNPNVKINPLQTPPDFDTQLLVDLAAGTAPDLWSQDASTLARLVDSGYVLDMRECVRLVPELNLDRFFPSVLAIHQREADGPIYGLPNDFTPMVIYYNTEAFKKAKVDPPKAGWTWADFVKTAQQLTLDNQGRNSLDPAFDASNVAQWGFRVRKFSFEWIYRVWENGGDVISPDGTTTSGYLDSPESIEAITWLRDLVTQQKVAPAPATLSDMLQQSDFLTHFLAGDVAMFDRGHWELVGLRANKGFKDGIFKVVPQPASKNGATVLYESGFVIRADLSEDRKKAACQFVEAATSRAYQDTKVLTGIAISANQESAADAVTKSADPEIEQSFIDAVAAGRAPYGSIYKTWPTIEERLDAMMERILAGGDVKAEVAVAVEEINRELSR